MHPELSFIHHLGPAPTVMEPLELLLLCKLQFPTYDGKLIFYKIFLAGVNILNFLDDYKYS